MNAQIKLTETKYPMGGCSIYKPAFRNMAISEIEAEQQDNLQSYAEFGFNSFTFNRACGLISINKMTVKTISDVLLTDQYGIL